jgi:hypothetical protein
MPIRSPISTLPPGLLLYIFTLAAGEPSALFDTSPLGFPRSGDWIRSWTSPYPYGYKSVAERVKTRTALPLVSKHWRTLASEVLFQYVRLDASSLRMFLLGMKEDHTIIKQGDFDAAAVPSTSARHMGRFVKHIDITFADRPGTDYVPLEIVNDEVSPLFRLLTNLELITTYVEFAVDGIGGEWTDVAERIVANVANNGCHLRSLVGMTDSTTLFPLIGTPQIDTIEVLELWEMPTMPGETFWDDIPPVTFQRLNTLSLANSNYSVGSLGSLFRWLSRCSMPSLTRYISRGPADWRDYVYPFFLVHGKSLVALDILLADHITSSLLLPYCPSLQEVRVDAYELNEFIPAIPKLAYIGLYHCYFPSDSIERSLQKLNLLHDCMRYIFTHRTRGTLAVIHLPDWDLEQISTLRLCGRVAVQKLRHWVEVCKTEGVRLEFYNNGLVEVLEDVDESSEEIR